MPYVQSERAILYFLHRGARSRGLQAGRERELVLGLCVERRGLLEMLISCSEGACVLQSVAHCLRVCLSERCLRECLSQERLRSLPFIVEGVDRGDTCVRYVAFLWVEVVCPSPVLVTVVAWSMERSCPRCTGAMRRSRPILCDVGAPVVARQERLLLLETCWSL